MGTPDWLEALASQDASRRDAAMADMRDYVKRTLVKGFGHQLDDALLEDLVQDTLLKVHDKRESFHGRSSVKTWVAAIAVNTTLMELRRRKHQHVELSAAVEAGEVASQPAAAPSQIMRRQVHEVLQQGLREGLTDLQRDALMAKLGGLPMSEISSRLGRTPGAVYKIMHDARKRLRSYLEARGFDAATVLGSPGGEA